MGAIVFDLDGTLIDSAPDLHGAACRMLADAGRPPLPLDTIRRFIGNGVPTLVERIIAASDLDLAEHAALTQSFLDHYAAHPADLTELYPGVRDSLEQLADAGWVMGICTNKPEAPARHILELFDLGRYFPVVVGGDTCATRKPDPEGLGAAFSALGEGHGVFVGDSEVDAETAIRAGRPFALFTEGYRKTPSADIPHDVFFSDFNALPELVASVGMAL